MITYAPIYGWDAIRLDGAELKGLAYPVQGPYCCAIELVSDNRIVGATRADQYSEFAVHKGLRDGWCAFSARLRPSYFIFSDELMVRCLVSATVIHTVDYGAIAWDQRALGPTARRPTSLTDLLAGNRSSDDRPLDWYEPIIGRVSERLDHHQVVTFLYKFLLGREPDGAAREHYTAELRHGTAAVSVARSITASDEFLSGRIGRLASPFDERFAAVPIFSS